MFLPSLGASVAAYLGNNEQDVYSLAGAGGFGIGTAATVYFYNDGSGDNVTLGAFDWVVPESATTRYAHEIRATLVSGPSPTGDSLGSWLNLNVTRSWGNDTVGTTVLTIEIRRTATAEVMLSGNIELQRDNA